MARPRPRTKKRWLTDVSGSCYRKSILMLAAIEANEKRGVVTMDDLIAAAELNPHIFNGINLLRVIRNYKELEQCGDGTYKINYD